MYFSRHTSVGSTLLGFRFGFRFGLIPCFFAAFHDKMLVPTVVAFLYYSVTKITTITLIILLWTSCTFTNKYYNENNCVVDKPQLIKAKAWSENIFIIKVRSVLVLLFFHPQSQPSLVELKLPWQPTKSSRLAN